MICLLFRRHCYHVLASLLVPKKSCNLLLSYRGRRAIVLKVAWKITSLVVLFLLMRHANAVPFAASSLKLANYCA